MLFVMLYLSGSHIYRMVTNFGGWDMDITTYTMLLTAKLSALAFCYKDGAMEEKDLLEEQKENKVVKMPTIIEMMSFTFFCCGCIVGPFFEYSDYIMFIEERGRYKHVPSTFVPSLIKLGQGLSKDITNYLQTFIVCMVLNLVLSQYFDNQFCATDEYASYSFPYKVNINSLNSYYLRSSIFICV
jgi:hypothetical protein